jgi:hypothetical protein
LGEFVTEIATHYRPVLLTRLGERQALQDLPEEDHRKFTPIFVVPPRAWNYEAEAFEKSLAKHLEKLPSDLGRARSGHAAFIDLVFIADDLSDVEGVHPLQWLHKTAQAEGVELIPVVSRSSPESLIIAARDVAADSEQGICLRLLPNEWPSGDPKAFDDLLSELEVSPTEIDLVLDLGEGTSSDLTMRALLPEIRWAKANGSWRSLTVAGAGVPKELPSGRGVHVMDRTDWLTFSSARRTITDEGLGAIDFGDHGIASADPTLDVDPRMLNISASFRYTVHGSWLLARGELFKGNGGRGVGGAAVPPTLQKLTEHPLYSTTPRDAANDWIDSVIAGGSGGNATTWRRWATFHHIKTVLGQLSK